MEEELHEKKSAAYLNDVTYGYRHTCDFTAVSNAFMALERVAFITFDVIFIQKDLPDYSAQQFAMTLRRMGIQTPVVLLLDRPVGSCAVVAEAVGPLVFGHLYRLGTPAELCAVIDQAIGEVQPAVQPSVPLAVAVVEEAPVEQRRRPNTCSPSPERQQAEQPVPVSLQHIQQLLQSLQVAVQQYQMVQPARPQMPALSLPPPQSPQPPAAKKGRRAATKREQAAYISLLGQQAVSTPRAPTPFSQAALPFHEDLIGDQQLFDAFATGGDLFQDDPYFDLFLEQF